MTMKIQLALQGGGAKIASLMAVMEAIQSLESEEVLKVSRIAGTSAGSLIGCIFAAGISMQTLRASLLAGKGKSLIGLFPTPKLRHMVTQPVSGRPFWSTRELEKGLAILFREQEVFKLSDLKRKTGTEVLIVAANLGTSTKEVYQGNDDIISSILDSCGLPYFFRTWDIGGRAGRVIVDGGICENLPSSELKDDPDDPIVAVTFPPTRPGTPQDVKSFTLALLETAMNNSIDRAKSALPSDRIHTIDTDIATFDFERGLEYGLRDHNVYSRARERAEAWFRKFVHDKLHEKEANAAALKRMEQEKLAAAKSEPSKIQEQWGIGGDFWVAQSAATVYLMRQIGKAYKLQHSHSKFKFLRCTFAVQANCLLEEHEPLYGTPDWFSYRSTFQPMNQPIYCISVALTSTPQAKFLGKTRWTVRDINNNIIETIDVPIQTSSILDSEHSEERELLMFFNPVLQPNNGPYSLLFQDEAMLLMGPLLNNKRDELEFYPRRAFGTVDRIDLLLHVPNRLKDSISMERRPNDRSGRAMTEGELADYTVPFGFHTLGWTGENLTVEDSFGVNLLYR